MRMWLSADVKHGDSPHDRAPGWGLQIHACRNARTVLFNLIQLKFKSVDKLN